MFEIHNNTIKDLISEGGSSGVQGNQQHQHKIHDINGKIIVSGLSVRPVATAQEVIRLLKEAMKIR